MPTKRKNCHITQKHFEQTASVLKGLRCKHNDSDAIVDDIVEILIPLYEKQNPRFKADLFREQCGVFANKSMYLCDKHGGYGFVSDCQECNAK